MYSYVGGIVVESNEKPSTFLKNSVLSVLNDKKLSGNWSKVQQSIDELKNLETAAQMRENRNTKIYTSEGHKKIVFQYDNDWHKSCLDN